MMKAGLLEEVRSLLPWKNLPVLKTVGYSELFDYLDEKTSLEEAVNKIKQHTRNYAKRQITWFKNKTEGIVINGEKSIENVVNFL
jgi:tRNA dimethylallyltransferase